MYSELTTKRIQAFNLQKGMFVSKLDMPWSATAFPIQGFLIETNEQIDQLTSMCQHVFIDLRLSKHIPYEHNIKLDIVSKPTCNNLATRINEQRKKQIKANSRIEKFRFTNYEIVSSFSREIGPAKAVYDEAAITLSDIIKRRAEINKGDMQALKAVSVKMVRSALNNPDALNWVAKINSSYKSLFQYALSTTITGVIFARHLGLEQRKIEFLTLSLLLRTIGLSKLKKSELVKYSPDNISDNYKRHLFMTLNKVATFKSLPSSVYNTLENHCENADGSGFPGKKSGHKIPMLSQIVRLVVYYDELVNPLVAARAISASKAISKVNAKVGCYFEAGLVEKFVQAVGIYPTGSFVELSDSSIGMVMEQNPAKRLRTNLAILKNAQGVNLDEPIIVDLADKKFENLVIKQSVPSTLLTPEQIVSCKTLFQPKKKRFSFLRRK
ncbi:DUF3391 domain-containing protein [Aliikangiella marina]|uniref:DUF3391 domain-containing protein n=1 Tax=Aliikangiella marina TaxID=1712262 RepID=A0A545T2Z2_9GAMM|nr:DUF3391 domain-containing protein [Aliikangiella marina]TQV71586.1 DUF3391 domain-containing protein [Aliikangiella marina]